MKRILSLFLIAPLSLAVLFSVISTKNDPANDGAYNYLIVGLDDASQNADSIIIASFSPASSVCSILQIPRDTLAAYNGRYGKINRIYALSRMAGLNERESMNRLSLVVEDITGLRLDGYLAMSPKTFSEYIDALGGVYITIPENFPKELYPLDLKLGENLLSGENAICFVRYREGYITADLGRMDAQKIFIDGCFRTATERIRPKDLLRLIGKAGLSPVFKLTAKDAISIFLRHSDSLASSRINILTLPGVATESDGISYFVANKISAQHAIRSYFPISDIPFDAAGILVDPLNSDFVTIYEKTGLPYKVYEDGKSLEIIP